MRPRGHAVRMIDTAVRNKVAKRKKPFIEAEPRVGFAFFPRAPLLEWRIHTLQAKFLGVNPNSRCQCVCWIGICFPERSVPTKP